MGWNPNEKIVRRVVVPADFDRLSLNGDTKKTLKEWADLGVTNPDGTPNIVNQYTYNIVKEVLDEIKKNAVVQVAIPAGSIMVQTNGGNAGGPVVGVGSNIISTTVRGLIR